MSSQKPPAGHFTILYFASASSYTKKQHDFFPGPVPLSQLPDLLEKQYTGIKDKVLGSCAVTVNLDYVDIEEETGKGDLGLVVQEGDEVAVIPPVSSG
ncbi:hypothetical protein Q7P37_004402 [Cladosporium fusiforme]